MQDKQYQAGRSILITGGTSGLGLELARYFLSEGYLVYALGRRMPASLLEIKGFRFTQVDLSDLGSTYEVIKKLADEMKRLDIIINNAGVLSPQLHTTTSDGIEYTFQVNYLSHIIINEILIRAGKVSPRAILVSVTSPVYRYVKPDFRICGPENYSGFRAYAESKYYTLLTGKYIEKILPGNDVVFFGFDPGTFSSGIARMQPRWFRKMYRIASPFMRKPGKPAANLFEIVTSGNIIPDAVYSSINKIETPQKIHGERNYNNFIDFTASLVAGLIAGKQ